ncbi:MAG: phosphoribosylanthranilate isomerase [Nitrospina sp.]|jgi:phosphoribosylanthranilate isomerase|nr:phosphoribosylanthranilate isomerase [Nitrospina sp.]
MVNRDTQVKVKVCGMTNLKDVLAAVDAGADAVGFIFYKKSPRSVNMKTVREIIQELPPFVDAVGVFVNETAEQINNIADRCNLDRVQLHGDESPTFCKRIKRRVIKAIRVKDIQSLKQLSGYTVSSFLLDTHSEGQQGGTGKVFDWSLAYPAKKYGSIILAGGLTPANVRGAIQRVQPYGVDVCSGVESQPGIKDHTKMRAFLKNVKAGRKI